MLQIRDIYPEFQIKKIPDPRFGSATKNSRILTLKIVSKLSEIWSGGCSRILIYFNHPGSRIPGSKRDWIPDRQHWKNKIWLWIIIFKSLSGWVLTDLDNILGVNVCFASFFRWPHLFMLVTSVADPWHFFWWGSELDPNPRIYASD